MLVLLSPAKSLDLTPIEVTTSTPRLLEETAVLIHEMQKKSAQEISALMKVSEKLGALNYNRFQQFDNADNDYKAAAYSFTGDVYKGLDIPSLPPEAVDYSQNHIRILSGLYGLLKPLDLMQPYRLEMGTRLQFDGKKNLYDFWGEKITDLINKDVETSKSKAIVNLASDEYFKSVKKAKLKAPLVNVVFKDFKNDKYKIISFYAKKARGLMARYIATEQANDIEMLKGFNYEGYSFKEDLSSPTELTFYRG